MPAKKKALAHPKKKVPASPTEEKVTTEESPKQERPVMQVVQVPEEEKAPAPTEPVQVQTPASLPEEPVVPAGAEKNTPAVVAPETPVEATPPSVVPTTPVPETPAEKETQESTVAANASPAKAASSPPSPSETFLEGLPPVKSSKKGLIIILIVLLLLLAGGVGGYIYLTSGMKVPLSAVISTFLPTKTSQTSPNAHPTPTAIVTPTPVPVDKAGFTMKVLNGSGIPGAAAKLQATLTADGYSISSTGNADNSEYTQTQILVKPSVSKAFVTVLSTDLAKLYKVSATIGSLPASSPTDVDVIIGSQTAQ